MKPCERCQGRGWLVYGNYGQEQLIDCLTCKGTGNGKTDQPLMHRTCGMCLGEGKVFVWSGYNTGEIATSCPPCEGTGKVNA